MTPGLKYGRVVIMDKMKEIPGYEGLYAATKDGKIYSLNYYKHKNKGEAKEIYPFVNHAGYFRIELNKGKKRKHPVHRLVALAWDIPKPKHATQINHIDGDKQNNSVSNLEWVSDSENKLKDYQTGRRNKEGENHHRAKLCEKKVRLIRELAAMDNVRLWEIALIFGVAVSTISQIKNRQRWSHI